MTAMGKVLTNVRSIASNKGNVRLFIVASLVWMLCAGFLSWQPLVHTYNDVLIPDTVEHSPEDINLIERQSGCYGNNVFGLQQTDKQSADCSSQVEAAANREVMTTNFERLARWLAIVLFLPVIVPGLLIGFAVISQWVNEGYKSEQ
jgi:hypothetical protein